MYIFIFQFKRNMHIIANDDGFAAEQLSSFLDGKKEDCKVLWETRTRTGIRSIQLLKFIQVTCSSIHRRKQ
jgi:hypothetical protein